MGRGKSQKNLDLIAAAGAILAEIQPATVRAVCYRLFTRSLIRNMSKSETNRVSNQLVYARKNGLIPWGWVVDETREAERAPTWANPADFAETMRAVYRRDRWTFQTERIEVWSEKGTVRGTLAPVLNDYGITFRVMHGYSSATTLHQIAQETAGRVFPLRVFYAGDWDPSGLHMSEIDLPNRLEEFGARVALSRIALTETDVTHGNLPWFEAATKRGDPRYRWFRERYGTRCWELDALNPVALRERIEDAIRAYIDWPAWDRCACVESAEHDSLVQVLETWNNAVSI